MSRQIGLLALIILLVTAGSVAAGVQVVFGPTIGDLTPTSVRISWYTNLPSIGYVQIGEQQLGRGGPTQAHRVLLEGLQPGEVYTYFVNATVAGQLATTGPYRFRTPAQDLNRFSFCVYGDTRSQPLDHRQVVLGMKACLPRLVVHTGDLVNDGHEMSDWHSFFPVIKLLAPTVPFYSCLGNHEGNAPLYYQLLPLPKGGGDAGTEWYGFVFGNCQFIVLDSNRRISEQAEWLGQILEDPRPAGVDWRIVLFHHPAFSSGPHGGSEEIQTQWCSLLEEGGVDLVFSGHDHIYERSVHNGLNYITCGNGGAPLYQPGQSENPYSQVSASVHGFCRVQVSPRRLVVTALSHQLAELDQVIITR